MNPLDQASQAVGIFQDGGALAGAVALALAALFATWCLWRRNGTLAEQLESAHREHYAWVLGEVERRVESERALSDVLGTVTEALRELREDLRP
jgi:hypothetical protein